MKVDMSVMTQAPDVSNKEPAYQADAEAIARVVAGQTDAFQPLVHRYFSTVYAVGLSELRDPDDAEEMAQEAFLRAYLALPKLGQPRYFAAWVHRIARNLAVEWQRQSRRESKLVQMIPMNTQQEDTVPGSTPSPREQAEKAQEYDLLQTAINELPKGLREVVLLHFAEDLAAAEIARRLGMNRSSVSRRLDKALATLRGALTGAPGDGRRLVVRRGAVARTTKLVGALAAAPGVTRAAVVASAGPVPAGGLSSGRQNAGGGARCGSAGDEIGAHNYRCSCAGGSGGSSGCALQWTYTSGRSGWRGV